MAPEMADCPGSVRAREGFAALGRAGECDWKLGEQDSKASRRSGWDLRPVGLLTPRPARGSVRRVAFSVGHVWPVLQHRQVSHVVAGLQQFFPQTGTERICGKRSVKDAIPAKKIIAERGWGRGQGRMKSREHVVVVMKC